MKMGSTDQVQHLLSQVRTAIAAQGDENVAHEHFRAIVESTDDAIISKSLDGVVTSWNAGARRLFGYTEEEMLGQPMLLLFPAGRLDEERFILEKILAGEKVDHFETQRVRKDGSLVDVSVTISPIRDATGRIVGASKIARDISERIQLERVAKLCESLVNSSDDAIISKTLDGVVTSWNPGAQAMFGYTELEMIGKPIVTLLPEHLQHEEAAILDRLRHGERVAHFETVRIHKDGHSIHVSVTISPICDVFGRVTGASKIVRDITEQKAGQARLQLTANVFTHTGEGIVITDVQGTILEVNDAFTHITGYDRQDVVGQHPSMFRSSRQGPEVYAALLDDLRKDGHARGEVWSRSKGGEAYAGLLTVSAVHDAQGAVQNYVALFADITPLRKNQEKLEHIAHFDALTDLPNRLLLADRLQQAMVMARRHQQSLAVLYLDLDGFKIINDRHGHSVGDALLITVAQRMKRALREVDTLARMGGDEFVVVLVDVKCTEDGIPLVERVLKACSEPVILDGRVLQVSASIGMTLYPQDDVDADQLMRHADQAMYLAKQGGKNRYQLFDSAYDAQQKIRVGQFEAIAQALQCNELVLHYQPKVNMRTGEVFGVEALIRWAHPTRGMLLPGSFMPTVESHSLGDSIGIWVVDAALAQMDAWQSAGLRLMVSVNIGARQLQQDNFAQGLRERLALHPTVDPTCLELEILETSALEDMDKVSGIMHACRAMGVRFAVDDFGTGYSSLTYLKRLPAETLKIDQSFVRSMLENHEDSAIVQGIIGLARAFQRHVIAEGVETVDQGVQLLQWGCSAAQGYGIARPMPGTQIPAWVESWQTHPAWATSVAGPAVM